jgi:malonate transporter and related proteins
MRGLLAAFVAIWAVTTVGWLIGRYGLLGPQADVVLPRLVFFVATPALLFVTLSTSDLHEIFTPALAAFVLSTVVVQVFAIVLARYGWHWKRSESVVAGLCASYVNAANLGIPVAAYALGDVSFAAPVLLFQVLVAAPLALTLLDVDDGSQSRLAMLPVRNPIILASAAGLILAVTGWQPPDEVLRPFQLVGSAAVPTALLALGLSLSADRVWALSVARTQLFTLAGLKVLAQPALAYLIARYALGLDGRPLLAAVITSGLPTAQNVFVFASRYQRAAGLARDSVVVTTLLTAVTLLLFAYWLGH